MFKNIIHKLNMLPFINKLTLKFLCFSKNCFSLAGFLLAPFIVVSKHQVVYQTKQYIYILFKTNHEVAAGPFYSNTPLTDYDILRLYVQNYDSTWDLSKLFATIDIHFHEIMDFITKSKYVARVWDIFYICPLAPETFCFIFALYNVLKASLLYYYYSQVTHNISNPILVKGISLSMAKTIYIQLQIVLLLFINPVIFDRVMVMCNGLIMSHGFISLFKIFSVFLFRIIIVYILEFAGILTFTFALETFCLMSFMILFTLLLFTSNNLIFTLMLFECVFFCLIPLMSSGYVQNVTKWNYTYELFINKNSYKSLLTYYNTVKNATISYSSLSAYGTIQYFLYNAFFLGIYIFAISFLFFYTRSFSYFELYSILSYSVSFKISLFLVFCFFCIISMICFKMGIVPYHGWMLAVFSNINIVPLMLLLLPFKLAIFSTGIRLFFGLLHPYLFLLQPILFCMAYLSMIIGAFGMYVQLDIRKFLLYSTINHSGYILISMCSGSIFGLKATILYVVIYILSTLGFLIFIGSTINAKTNKPFTNFMELACCSNLTIFPFIVFFMILLSMAGIPPLAGFWGKFYVLQTLYTFGFLGWIGIVIIIITSTITVVGYLRVIKFFFFDHTITTTILVKSYNMFCLRVLFFVFCFLVFFYLINLFHYHYFGNEFYYKIYCFFRLVL